MSKPRKYFLAVIRSRKLFFNGLAIVAILVLLEALFVSIMSWPSRFPHSFILLGRGIYLNNRDLIQYNEHCAMYDAQLTYTLRPGVCRFKGAEFDVTVSVNSAGFRDDETSLLAPEIIVIGDSHAMGWGVEDSQTFASQLEAMSGLRVLNAAISSYATAREVQVLDRIDLTALKALIVQYCPNDYWENVSLNSGQFGRATSNETYRQLVEHFSTVRSYRFGDYLSRTLQVQVLNRMRRWFVGVQALPDPTGPAPRAPNPKLEVDVFTESLTRLPPEARRSPIIVIAIDAFGRTDFTEPFMVRLAADKGNALDVRPLQIRGLYEEAHFFRLDDHLNAAGHAHVAQELLRQGAIAGFQ